MRGLRWRVIVAAVVCGLVVPAAAAATALPPIKHVFVLIDENESASSTFGTPANDPYLATTLRSEGAYLPDYYGIGHSSLDNYIAMVSGQAPNPFTSGDCPTFENFPADSLDASGQENGEGCVYPADVPTLMQQLDSAGLTWRSYDDSMGADPTRESATCGHPSVGSADNTESETASDQYPTRHDPFVYFHHVIDNASECNAGVVGFNGDGPVGSSQLSTDLQSAATTPNYVFITPSLCNDGHDATCLNGQAGGLAAADAFLRKWVPVITSSRAYQQNGLLIITFDEAEGDSTACCGEVPGPYDLANGIQPGGTGPGGGVVGAVLLSPYIKPGTISSTPYNHYSMLASVEDLFGLPRIGDAAGVTSFGNDVFTNSRPRGSLAISRRAKVSRSGVAAVRLSCSGASGSTCVGTLTLMSTVKVRTRHRVRGVARTFTRTKTIRLGSARYSLAANRSETLRIPLSKTGAKLLQQAASHKLTAEAAAKPPNAMTTTKTVELN